jgi:cytosine/adenosine deaminase-related metal-dependent hydrolase
MLLRARVVLPVSRPPIDDGAVWISGNRIRAVCSWREMTVRASEQVLDLGDTILLPGLINAHCHLDYTDLAGEIPATRLFTDWIKSITTAKAGKIYADFAQSWLRGAQMLLRTGTTTVADIEAVPELLPEVWLATPLRVFSFLEMTGVKSRREPRSVLDDAVRKIESLPEARGGAGLSPHAPYSTMPELLRLSVFTARQKGWRLVTHVAESDLEFEMFSHARGEMFDWLQRNERDMSDCGLGSPVQHLERHGFLANNLLAVHVNYLAQGDAALLSRRGVSVAHCPRSHAFFQHRTFPRGKLAGVGVNMCLGTDSLASVTKVRGRSMELNLFTEMQTFAAAHPDVPPETLVRMATLNAARALGMQGTLGQLSENALADLVAVPFNGNCADAFEAVVHHTGDVAASMIDGQWVKPHAS